MPRRYRVRVRSNGRSTRGSSETPGTQTNHGIICSSGGWSVVSGGEVQPRSRDNRRTRRPGRPVPFAPRADAGLQEHGTPDMGRDLLRAILPVLATFESRRRSERVLVAMREIKVGRRITRSGIPPRRPRRMSPEKSERILRLKAQGLTYRVIAQRVGLPGGHAPTSFRGPAEGS